MHDTLLIAILAGLGGMIGWGAADFFAKKTVDRIGPIKSLVWAHLFGTTIFIGVATVQSQVLEQPIYMPYGSEALFGLIFFGVLQMIVYWLLYKGFEKGQLAVLNPIFASYSGLVALASIIIFREKAGMILAIALAAIFVGIILLNVDIKGLRSRKLNIVPGLKEVAAGALLAAGWTLGWDKFIDGKDALAYSLWMYIFMSLAALGLAMIMRVNVFGVTPKLWKFLVLIGAGEVLAYLSISWGFSATPLTSIVALISGAFSVPTVILAYIFLKERITVLQTSAIVLIIAGIIGVSVN